MCNTRTKTQYEHLKSIYDAIKQDDAAALEAAVKNSAFTISKPFSVYEDNYEPVNSLVLFNLSRAVTTKTLIEIAAAMGHAQCVSWLINHDADLEPLFMQSITLHNDSVSGGNASELYRFIDDRTNYIAVAGISMAAMDNLKPEQLDKLRNLMEKPAASSANRPA